MWNVPCEWTDSPGPWLPIPRGQPSAHSEVSSLPRGQLRSQRGAFVAASEAACSRSSLAVGASPVFVTQMALVLTSQPVLTAGFFGGLLGWAFASE